MGSKAERIADLKAQCTEAQLALLEGPFGDNLPALHEWPLNMATRFLKPTCTHADRMQLVWFLAVNAAPPNTLIRWAKARPGYLRWQQSCHDLISLLLDWQIGNFAGANGKEAKTAWCMYLGMAVPVHAPSFAKEFVAVAALGHKAGCSFFEDALTEIRQYAKTLPREC